MIKDLVSVIIPTYGGPEFLPRCIDSVLSQTYKKIEIIVVDDNGLNTPHQKETAKMMEKYKHLQNVKYICHEVNRNGSAARNTGVKASSGEYIAFLDDDDEYYPEFVENQINLLCILPNDFALSYTSFEQYSGNKLLSIFSAKKEGYLLYDVLIHSFEIPTSSMMIKRKVVEEFRGFDETFKRHQDWEFLVRIASKYKIKCNDCIGYKRHVVFRNSPKNTEQYKEYRIHWLSKMKPYINMLDIKQQKNVYLLNRMDILLYFLKNREVKGFIKEWQDVQPGIFGVKYILRKITAYITK